MTVGILYVMMACSGVNPLF